MNKIILFTFLWDPIVSYNLHHKALNSSQAIGLCACFGIAPIEMLSMELYIFKVNCLILGNGKSPQKCTDFMWYLPGLQIFAAGTCLKL